MFEHTSPGTPGLDCRNIVFFCFFDYLQDFFVFLLVFIGFSMVLARFFNEIIVFSTVLFGFSLVFFVFSLVSFGFSLDLLVSLRAYWVLYWLFSGLIWFSIGFTMGLARLYCSGTLRRGWREQPRHAPDASETLQSSKKLQNGCFSKLFVRVSGYESLGCSWALISVFSSHTY